MLKSKIEFKLTRIYGISNRPFTSLEPGGNGRPFGRVQRTRARIGPSSRHWNTTSKPIINTNTHTTKKINYNFDRITNFIWNPVIKLIRWWYISCFYSPFWIWKQIFIEKKKQSKSLLHFNRFHWLKSKKWSQACVRCFFKFFFLNIRYTACIEWLLGVTHYLPSRIYPLLIWLAN